MTLPVFRNGVGNIPACAGKTGRPRGCYTVFKEHPRVRGENPPINLACTQPKGTSPRARGKRGQYGKKPSPLRNIPACAGKTRIASMASARPEEHPRVRGENGLASCRLMRVRGTSPRARGKPQHDDRLQEGYRNIPACAGKTLIDVRFLVPEGHFTFGFVFLHRGGSMESPCSSLLSECFSARIVVYGQLGTSLLSAYGCAFWWDGG